MMLPLETHGTQTARMGKQAEASEPTKKRAWQTIVRAKVRAQWSLLAALGRPEPGLEVLIKAVQSGDIKTSRRRRQRAIGRRSSVQHSVVTVMHSTKIGC